MNERFAKKFGKIVETYVLVTLAATLAVCVVGRVKRTWKAVMKEEVTS